jgi:hypothetical protein
LQKADDGDQKKWRYSTPEIIAWLMEGDPSIRWQVMRDLLEEDDALIEREQARVAEIGWGARFLSCQEPSGLWAGGIYSPKWISTTYTMLTLRRIGLPIDHPQAHKGCQLLLERGFYQDGGINYAKSHKQSEACITGMVLSILAYFHYADVRIDELATHLLNRQMDDWGWNCRDYSGDTHSSFHTTISALEGLLEYQKSRAEVRLDVEEARVRGHEFLLQHRLFKSHRTGEIVNPRMLRFPYPPRWFYDFLRALDYFQDYYHWKNAQVIDFKDDSVLKLDRKHMGDERFLDAIELLKNKRKPDGRWLMIRGPSGKVYFEMEKAGKPSRWNTLRALRVLNWWEGGL